MADTDTFDLPAALLDHLLERVVARYPRKSFGYLLADPSTLRPSDFVIFDENIRNHEDWRNEFESRGRYFVDHPDAGFVATPEESWRIHRELRLRGLAEVAVFHTHRRHPGNFSGIDYDLHTSRFSRIRHVIISLRNPRLPQVRAFAVAENGTRELQVTISPAPASHAPQSTASILDLRYASEVLKLDRLGRPACRESRRILDVFSALQQHPDHGPYHEFVTEGFLAGTRERFHEFIEPLLVLVDGPVFEMGTAPEQARHFCGETPRHWAELSAYQMSSVAVTNEVYGLLRPERNVPGAAARLPVVDISWFDAALFATWVGCRLPTEAEWEFACGAGSELEWCCAEDELHRYAWYSENAERRAHEVATRLPNTLGLFDMHGNVWEWCQDSYVADYYGRSPVRDPVAGAREGAIGDGVHRVSRGGGFLALAEMCRTRYRLHDPAEYFSSDLGVRLARSPSR